MSSYSIDMHGSHVDVKVIDHPSLLEEHMKSLQSQFTRRTSPKVIGMDIKLASYGTNKGDDSTVYNNMIVLCASSNFALIVHKNQCPNFLSLLKGILTGSADDLCIVVPHRVADELSVQELAARVLKKPSLCSASLAAICKEVGVEYEDNTGTAGHIPVDERMSSIILSEEQVKLVISDAFASQQIASKLLNSL